MTKTSPPPERNYAAETRENLKAQIELSPDLLKAEQATRPGWTALELATTNDALWGAGGNDGLVSQYEKLQPRLTALEQASLLDSRKGDINAVRELGPEAINALKATNPEAFALLSKMTSMASDDLNAGVGLSDAEQRQVNQAVRGGQAARGLALGPAEVYQEAVATNEAGNMRRQQRLANATQAIQLNQALMGDPFLQILGRPSNTFSQTQTLTGQGQSMDLGPDLFNPESQYGADLNNVNYQGNLAARTATSSNRAGLFGGLLGAFGKLGGAAIGKWG